MDNFSCSFSSLLPLLWLSHVNPVMSFVEHLLFAQNVNLAYRSRHNYDFDMKRIRQPFSTSPSPRKSSFLRMTSQSNDDDLDYNILMEEFLYVSRSDTDYDVLPPPEEEEEVAIEIVHENMSYELTAFVGESILSALERNRASSSRLPLPPIPHDCRKGSCMTCSGRVLCATTSNGAPDKDRACSLVRGDDGLNPSLSKQVESEGYVLLCSSFVMGPGLKIEIGCKEEVWNLTYKDRMTSDSETDIRSAAVAKSMRLASEKNVSRWTEKVERILKNTTNKT